MLSGSGSPLRIPATLGKVAVLGGEPRLRPLPRPAPDLDAAVAVRPEDEAVAVGQLLKGGDHPLVPFEDDEPPSLLAVSTPSFFGGRVQLGVGNVEEPF